MSPHGARFSFEGKEDDTSRIPVVGLVLKSLPRSPSLQPLSLSGTTSMLWWAVKPNLPGNIPWRSHPDWCYTFCSQKISILEARKLAEENGQLRKGASVFKPRGALGLFRMGRRAHTPWSLSIRMAGWPVWTLNRNLEITKLFACRIAIYILYKWIYK